MNTNTGELGSYDDLVQKASDPTDVVPIPEDLRRLAQKHIERRRFVNLQGNSRLAQFARDHQRRKRTLKAKTRRHNKEVRKAKSTHQRRRQR